MPDDGSLQNGDSLPLNIYGDVSQITRLFYRFTALILAAQAIGILIVLINKDTLYAIIIAISILPILATFFLIRRKQFEWAAVLLALVMLSLITVLATDGLGIHHLSSLAYPTILIVAGMVIRKRTMVLLTLYAIGCVAWLVFGELSGAYIPRVLVRSVPGDFLAVSMVIVVTAFMVRLLTETLFQNNLRLQQELAERKRAEERLEQNIALRQQAEAEREKLIGELKASNTELEQFTYTVSHDLKAPLITIRGFLELLEEDVAAGQQERVRDEIRRIKAATDRMRRLLDELLELSRVGRLVNPPQEIPFEAVAREAVDLLAGAIRTRGVQVQIARDLPVVYGDRVRLVEVVQNLVDNAVKFMGDQPEPRIDIGARAAETGGGLPIFFVRDNGMGLAPATHERIFDLFHKLDVRSAGTGVGLALVKRIVEVHGGRIWVESDGLNAGSTFCFTLNSTTARLLHG